MLKYLFYTGNCFGFRSLPIWQVWETAQKYQTILLAEKLDTDTEMILNNKEFFPMLEIVPVRHNSNSLKLMIKNNKALYREAKEVIEKYKPDIVITGAVVYPFPLYLRRIAHRKNILNISPFSPRIYLSDEIKSWVSLVSAYQNNIFGVWGEKIRKRLGHILYYWILPLMVGEWPFRDEPGCILFNKISGKSSDYYISFFKKDYDNALKDGMPIGKLLNMPKVYPKGYDKVREFLRDRFAYKKTGKILTIMWPHTRIGIRKDKSLITEKETEEQRIRIIKKITEILPDWKIIIKPHPEAKDNECDYIKEKFGNISDNIEIVNKMDWADAYTEISDIVMGLPPTSITLYTASLICPEKTILSLDFEHELLGDGFKDFQGIKYIDNEKDFIDILMTCG